MYVQCRKTFHCCGECGRLRKTRRVCIRSSNKMVALEYVIHWGNKLCVPPNAVQVEMPPALSSKRFRYLCISSCMTGIRRCPVLSTRSAQKIRWEEEEEYQKMKQGNSNLPHFSLRAHQVSVSPVCRRALIH